MREVIRPRNLRTERTPANQTVAIAPLPVLPISSQESHKRCEQLNRFKLLDVVIPSFLHLFKNQHGDKKSAAEKLLFFF